MFLKKYREKRKFNKTPEPSGSPAQHKGKPLIFVIQKHEASRLHYDFRLELDGVLKSWAVPKGPSMNPKDKRLAMMVEDHPYSYKDFEGIIPKGNYGAGTVMIWDEGAYISLKDPKNSEKELQKELERGLLEIVLLGKKIKGAFDLVRSKNYEENSWLLIKREDEYATKKDITKEDTSVLSGRSMEQIAQRKDAVWTSNKDLDLSEVPKRKLKSPVSLMKAVLGKESFDNSEWIYEIKWDGYRAIAEIEKNKVQLNSRNNISYNQLFSPIVESLKVIKQEMILDGEVVVVDEKGRAKFQLLQQYKKTRKGNLVYYVFDILSFDGHDLTGLSIVERKELLKKVLPQSSILKISEHIEKDGVQFYKAAKEQGIEGIIAKKIDSKYELGRRSNNWKKIKTKNRQEAIICGYTEPRGGRKL